MTTLMGLEKEITELLAVPPLRHVEAAGTGAGLRRQADAAPAEEAAANKFNT